MQASALVKPPVGKTHSPIYPPENFLLILQFLIVLWKKKHGAKPNALCSEWARKPPVGHSAGYITILRNCDTETW